MQTVVHIGPHKTGTTTIQAFFAEAFPRDPGQVPALPGLVESVYYPRSADDACPYNHSLISNIAIGINGHQADPAILQRLLQDYRDHAHTVILSAEDFSKDITTGFTTLQSGLAFESDLVFLVGWRPWSARAAGLLGEIAFHVLPNPRGIEEFQWELIGHPACRIDYPLQLARAFPHARILVLDLTTRRLAEGMLGVLEVNLGLSVSEFWRTEARVLLDRSLNERLDTSLTKLLNSAKSIDEFANPSAWPGIRQGLISMYRSGTTLANSDKNSDLSPIEIDVIRTIDTYEADLLDLAFYKHPNITIC